MSWYFIKQVDLDAKFSMHPKVDMIHKECGFNQSETASCLRACVSWRFWCSPAMSGDGELIQTQYFCHHASHNFPRKRYVTTKLDKMSACECTNNTIFQNEVFSSFLPSTYVTCQRRSICDATKVARWRHWWIHHFSCLQLRFCITTVSNIMVIL